MTISRVEISGANSGDYRMLRGGSWFYKATRCTVAYRFAGTATFGATSLTSTGYEDIFIAKFGQDYTDNEENSIPVLQTGLTGNYPNPFNPQTTIEYSIKDQLPVKIGIYNHRGQLVINLINAQHRPGSYTVIWDGRDHNNRPVSSGIYYYRLQAGGYITQRKMILLK